MSTVYANCASCGRRIFGSGGHHVSCPVARRERSLRSRQAPSIDTYPIDDEFDEYQITGGMTESDFFGGDVGDKG